MTENPSVPDPVDVRNNRESVAAAADTTTSTARASGGGPPPKEAPAAGELPDSVEGGAASGDPVAGVEISPEDRAEAVAPDEGQTEQEGPPAGHA